MFTSLCHCHIRLSRFQPSPSQYRRYRIKGLPFPVLILVILFFGFSGLLFAPPKCQAADSYKERRMEKIVPQTTDFSCGAASVATLCRYVFGLEITEKDAIGGMFKHGEQEKIRQRGFSMLDMKRFALNLGLQAQGYKIKDINLLKQMKVPVITIIDTGKYKHFVVLRKVDDRFAYLSDPSWGNCKMVLEDFLKNWDNVILVLTGPCRGTPEGLYREEEESELPQDRVIREAAILGHPLSMDSSLATIYTVTSIPSGSGPLLTLFPHPNMPPQSVATNSGISYSDPRVTYQGGIPGGSFYQGVQVNGDGKSVLGEVNLDIKVPKSPVYHPCPRP